MKPIVVDGCIITTNNATAQVVIKSVVSNKVSAGSGIYKSPLEIQIVGATLGSLSQTTPFDTAIQTTATKVFVENTLCMLEGDNLSTSVPAIDTSSGSTGSISITVKIENAGQNKVLGV